MSNVDLSIYRGEMKTWQWAATDKSVAVSIVGATIRWTVRTATPDSATVVDTDAVIAKTTADGAIVITNGAGGLFEASLVKSDTNTLAPGTYIHGIELVLQGQSDPVVLAQGTFVILADIVRAS